MGWTICKNTVASLLLCLLFTQCKKEHKHVNTPLFPQSKKTLVVCEGSLGNGNAALTIYDRDSNKVYDDVFMNVNGQPLGDIFQSITPMGNYYFLCVNNSDKVWVLHQTDFKIAGNISITKPRYILPINDQKAYVSTLFSNKIVIIHPQTWSILGEITLPARNAEVMTLWNNQVIACGWDTTNSHIFYIDTQTDKVIKSVPVAGKAPQESFMDKDGLLWVLSGDAYNKIDAVFTKLNPATGQVVKTYNLPPQTEVIKPVCTKNKDSVYFIEVQYDGSIQNNGIYRMSTAATDIPTQPFLAAEKFQYFWALGIEPTTGHLWIGDPKGFTQKGTVSVYRQDGQKLQEYKTGVGPAQFHFAE